MTRFRYKQLLPLLVALILPTVVIAVLGWKNASKERELAEKRLMDARQQTVGTIRQEILARLERIKLQEIAAAPVSPASRTASDSDPAADRFRQSIEEPDFLRKIAEAERAELADRRYDQAANLYRESAAVAGAAKNQSQALYARFRLARTLARGQAGEAIRIYQDLVTLPSTVVDESGIPFASYAAKRLLDLERSHEAERNVLNRMNLELKSPGAVTPTWVYVFKGVLETLRQSSDPDIKKDAGHGLEQLSVHVRYLEQLQALHSDFAAMRLTPMDWQPYRGASDDSWLLGMTPARGESRPLVIAVHAERIFESVVAKHVSPGSAFQFEISTGTGEPLGENLPGLRIRFLSAGEAGASSPDSSLPSAMRFSPDGRTVAYHRLANNNFVGEVMLADASSGAQRIFAGTILGGPVWSPTGNEIAFSRLIGAGANLLVQGLTGGTATTLLADADIKRPLDWSLRGDLLYDRENLNTATDIFVLPVGGEPIPVANTAAYERFGRFAPNGHWISYTVQELGKLPEVFVQPFPGGPEARRQVSVDGGYTPQWGRSGRELYFRSDDNHLMVVSMMFSEDGKTLDFGKPVPLFPSSLPDGVGFAASPDGERFLINPPTEGVPPITVLTGWSRARR